MTCCFYIKLDSKEKIYRKHIDKKQCTVRYWQHYDHLLFIIEPFSKNRRFQDVAQCLLVLVKSGPLSPLHYIPLTQFANLASIFKARSLL